MIEHVSQDGSAADEPRQEGVGGKRDTRRLQVAHGRLSSQEVDGDLDLHRHTGQHETHPLAGDARPQQHKSGAEHGRVGKTGGEYAGEHRTAGLDGGAGERPMGAPAVDEQVRPALVQPVAGRTRDGQPLDMEVHQAADRGLRVDGVQEWPLGQNSRACLAEGADDCRGGREGGQAQAKADTYAEQNRAATCEPALSAPKSEEHFVRTC